MEFSWNEDDAERHTRTREFAQARLNEDLDARFRAQTFPRAAWDAAGDFGLAGLNIDAEHGGMGLSSLSTAYAMEALGEACEDMGLVFSIAAHLFACATPIDEFGDDGLKARVLPKLATGQWIGANAITEDKAGSDAFAMATRAEKDGDHYILNGAKSYVTNAAVCDVLLVYASTAPKFGHLGITAFVVDRQTPGITVGTPFDKIGLQTAKTSSVYFDNVRVPQSARLGDEGAGASIFTGSMSWERTGLFAAYNGLAARMLDRSVQYAKERKQFGQSIGRFQAIAHRLADLRLELDAARLLLYRACWLRDQGRRALSEVAMAKIAASEVAIHAATEAIQFFGGNGVMTEYGIERALRDAIPSKIFSGTSEMQRNIIASELGL